MSQFSKTMNRLLNWWRRVWPGSDDLHKKHISRWFTLPLLGVTFIAALLVFGSLLGIEITEEKGHRAGAEGEFFELDGVELHARLIGGPGSDPTGVPLLLIHGFTISGSHEYDRIIPELKTERSLILPDLLGFGHSDRLLHTDERYTRAGQADLLVELLRETGVDQVDIVATSYGGGVALKLSLNHPDRIRKLALIDAQVDDLQSAELQSLCEFPLNLDRIIFWNYQGSSPLSEAIALENCGDVGYCPTEAELAIRKEIAQIEGTTEALTAFCESQTRLDIIDDLDTLQKPILLVWGLQDEVLSDRQRRLLIEHAHISEQVLLEATGHAPHLERPARVAQFLLDFFSERTEDDNIKSTHLQQTSPP